jgi:hypothetical protein
LVTQHHISWFRRPSLHRAPTLHRRDTDIDNPNALRRYRIPALPVAQLMRPLLSDSAKRLKNQ